ncbi:helix-turn-helix domain-containing protein [Leifsonia shinshuensis]
MAGYFEQTFGSDDVDESEDWLNTRYGHVDVTRSLTRYDERVVGDDRFFLTEVSTFGRYECAIDPDTVLVVAATPGFRWELDGDEGSPTDRPALFQPGRPYLAKVADSDIIGVGLPAEALQRTARLLYGHDELEVRFDGPYPAGDRAGARWLAALELVRREEARGLLGNDLIRASAYRLLAVTALESFRLVGDRSSLRASAARRTSVYRAGARFLRDHASLPITVEDAALAAGASTRELLLAFRSRNDEGVTPARYLRRVRLDAARHELTASADAAPAVDAQAIVERWGFGSPAAFELAYRREYAGPSVG